VLAAERLRPPVEVFSLVLFMFTSLKNPCAARVHQLGRLMPAVVPRNVSAALATLVAAAATQQQQATHASPVSSPVSAVGRDSAEAQAFREAAAAALRVLASPPAPAARTPPVSAIEQTKLSSTSAITCGPLHAALVGPRLCVLKTLLKPLLNFEERIEIPVECLRDPVESHYQVALGRAPHSGEVSPSLAECLRDPLSGCVACGAGGPLGEHGLAEDAERLPIFLLPWVCFLLEIESGGWWAHTGGGKAPCLQTARMTVCYC
jgi:hypothetical protein